MGKCIGRDIYLLHGGNVMRYSSSQNSQFEKLKLKLILLSSWLLLYRVCSHPRRFFITFQSPLLTNKDLGKSNRFKIKLIIFLLIHNKILFRKVTNGLKILAESPTTQQFHFIISFKYNSKL